MSDATAADHRMTGSRVLVTGANGFIGRSICRYVGDFLVPTFGTDRTLGQEDGFWGLDLLDVDALGTVLDQCAPSIVFHAAGLVGSDDSEALHKAHVETTRALLSAVQKSCPAARVVILGSAAEYGVHLASDGLIQEGAEPLPQSAYGRSKLAQSEVAQQMAELYDLDVVRTRVFNTIGPGQGLQLVAGAMTRRLHSALTQGAQDLEVYDPDSCRDFLDVRDVARLLWIVASRLEREADRPPVHIASGQATSIVELARGLLEVAGVENRIQLKRVPTLLSTSLIGKPSTLSRLLTDSSIRQIGLDQSLADMWKWEIQQHKGDRIV